MSALNKRSRSPNEQSDDDDLTVDKLEDFFDPSLTDRQRMSWALQTEQRVRLAKLEGRDSGGGSSARSTTLRSKYLFDLYPTIDDELMKSSGRKDILFLDFLKFRRKCRPELAVARPPDASFDETLIHLDIGSHEMDPNAVQQQQQGEVTAVPPNMLYFEILLEAFMGYKFPRYSPPSSSSLPKAAVMGGAIVAVLTSWRQSKVSDQIEADFASMNIKYAWWSDCKDDPTNLSTSKETIKDYLDWKTDMISTLREHFLYHGDDRQEQHGDDDESGGREHDESSSSAFATGDVDIFLQPSTVTRNLVQALTAHGLTSDLQGHIESYMGGMGFAQNELYRASKQLCWDIKKNVKEFPGQKAYGYYCHGGNEVGVLVFALTRHALSFICGARDDGEKAAFPRTTQMILLHEDADLVGALMDFDISVACCAYDGTNVWIAPRAALSLCTLTQVVTPFVLEEKRNRRRIIKVSLCVCGGRRSLMSLSCACL